MEKNFAMLGLSRNSQKDFTFDHASGESGHKDAVEKVIYQFWTDDNPITPNRMKCLKTSKNFRVTSKLFRPQEIAERELKEFPFHEAYRYLSSIHKADYLRCYFLHHFGGGYADIKFYSKDNNWKECFDYINRHPEVDVIGEQEIMGGSPIRSFNDSQILPCLLANGYFIVRPHSEFSSLWYRLLHRKLDEKLELLRLHPAQGHFDCGGSYPLRWAEIMGELFHICCYHFRGTGKVLNILESGKKLDVGWR